MLAFRIHYLTGRVYASSFFDRSRVEWPPHPDRFFSALVAAAARAGIEDARAALEWLEQQQPPHLYAPPLLGERSVLVQVPVNDIRLSEAIPIHSRLKQPRWFPSGTIGGNRCAYMIWPDANPPQSVRDMLARIAEHVTYLGNSMSLVAVELCDNPPKANWVPDPTGKKILRVPVQGRYEELELAFHVGRRPRPSHQVRYRFCEEDMPISEKQVKPVPFQDFYPFALHGRFPLEATLTLTETVRAALLSLADQPPPAILHGHEPRLHCAFIPLPFVGSAYADGHVVGFAVLIPRGVDESERRAVLRALARLKHLALPGGIVLPVERMEVWRSGRWPWALAPWRWQGPAYRWASVTPVVFDHHPKSRERAAEALIRSCQYAGLPEPVRAEVVDMPPLRGVPPSRAFHIVQPGTGERFRNHYIAHVVLEFDQPVKGPVLIGAGRYFGLGLFAPLEKREVTNA